MPCAVVEAFFPPFLPPAHPRKPVFMHINNYPVVEQGFSKP